MKMLRSFFTITLTVFFCAVTLQAQTLVAGDIAFIGLYSSGSGGVGDAFTFITLKALPEGTVIYFTDDGWNNGAWGGASSEVHFTWSPPPGGSPIGNIVTITGGPSQTVPGTPSIGTCSAAFLSGTTWHYATGEGIIAYQSSTGARPASPTFISGMLAYYNGTIYNSTTKWCSTTAGYTQQASTLPDGLTNGRNCVSVFNATYNPTVANCRYNGSLTGTASDVRALINSDANWTRASTTPFDITSAAFSIPSITADPVVITFTDGSAFTQNLSSNSNNQVLGRFRLTGDANGAALTAASIKLNNARTGLSNLKLWSSTDATFSSGSDTQLGSAVAADPGNGSSATFSGFSSAIGASGTYYFITADLAAGASGTVQCVIAQNSSQTLTGGTLTGSIVNAVLSNAPSPLPVELVSFEATAENNTIRLRWHTATEVNNYGFELERRSSADVWKRIGFVEGNGTSNTPNQYSFVDISGAGTFQYRLKQIDRDGTFEYSKEVEMMAAAAPTVFALLQNYPNPFNPTTSISFTVPSTGRATLKIMNILGQEVATLFTGEAAAGTNQVQFNASGFASGMYISRLEYDGKVQLKKMSLIK